MLFCAPHNKESEILHHTPVQGIYVYMYNIYENTQLRFREGNQSPRWSLYTCTSAVSQEERTSSLLGFYSSASICKVVKQGWVGKKRHYLRALQSLELG